MLTLLNVKGDDDDDDDVNRSFSFVLALPNDEKGTA